MKLFSPEWLVVLTAALASTLFFKWLSTRRKPAQPRPAMTIRQFAAGIAAILALPAVTYLVLRPLLPLITAMTIAGVVSESIDYLRARRQRA